MIIKKIENLNSVYLQKDDNEAYLFSYLGKYPEYNQDYEEVGTTTMYKMVDLINGYAYIFDTLHWTGNNSVGLTDESEPHGYDYLKLIKMTRSEMELLSDLVFSLEEQKEEDKE